MTHVHIPSAQGTSLKRYEEELDRSKFHLLNCCCCCSLITKSCLILCNPTDGIHLCPWDFPGKNTGVGGHFLLQGIFLTQGLNPRLLSWQADSLSLSHLGSPFIEYLLVIEVDIYIISKETVQELPKLTTVSNTFLNRLHYPVS